MDKLLKPYRDNIDAIDDQIVDLLAARLQIVDAVVALKVEHKIPAVLQDRIDEVITRCIARADEKNVDPALVQDLYQTLIDFCCQYEDSIIQDQDANEHESGKLTGS